MGNKEELIRAEELYRSFTVNARLHYLSCLACWTDRLQAVLCIRARTAETLQATSLQQSIGITSDLFIRTITLWTVYLFWKT